MISVGTELPKPLLVAPAQFLEKIPNAVECFGVLIIPSKLIPENEAWVFDNDKRIARLICQD